VLQEADSSGQRTEKRRAVVTTNVRGRDLASFVSEAKRRIESDQGEELRAAGCRFEFDGQ
jgi:Cu/Ag efflux pump CusA